MLGCASVDDDDNDDDGANDEIAPADERTHRSHWARSVCLAAMTTAVQCNYKRQLRESETTLRLRGSSDQQWLALGTHIAHRQHLTEVDKRGQTAREKWSALHFASPSIQPDGDLLDCFTELAQRKKEIKKKPEQESALHLV